MIAPDDYKSHSVMLGRIANIVSDFCEKDTDTTLVAVARLKARYLELEARFAWELLDNLEKEAEEEEEEDRGCTT